MMTNLPVNRSSSTPRTAPGIATHAGAAPDKSQRDAPTQTPQQESRGISVKVQRHGHWALMSRTQSQLSRLQASEQAIINSYRQLLNLAKQLDSASSNSEALAAKVANLRQQLAQSDTLDNNLRRREGAARASYVLDKVDLLSPRKQTENMGLQLPNGANLNLKLEANAGRDKNLQTLQTAFEKQGLSVGINAQNQLQFRGSESVLGSPWMFRGEGVRVPAGNPVPIQLSQEADELARLEAEIRGGERDQQKQRVRHLLGTLEQERRALENQRQQLLREIAQLNLRESQNSQAPEVDSATVRTVLRDGDFSLQLSTLLAQANVSRFSVVALLAR